MSAGHIRQRSANSWELKFDAGIDPTTGKRITRFKTIRGNKRDAQRELRDILGSVDSGKYVEPNKLTLAAWLQQWLAEAQHTVAPKTLQRYREIV